MPAWIIALSPHEAPERYRMWLQLFQTRLILISEQTSIARTFEPLLPNLTLVAHPSRAAAFMADVLNLGLTNAGPPLVLGRYERPTRG